ncbi:hypothetical protein [Comamonas odontotermitis]|uniref:hypothetical protein n=1 Tax=Comamonas odontotermitis TaxID=379895 RepID=UPI003671BB1F
MRKYFYILLMLLVGSESAFAAYLDFNSYSDGQGAARQQNWQDIENQQRMESMREQELQRSLQQQQKIQKQIQAQWISILPQSSKNSIWKKIGSINAGDIAYVDLRTIVKIEDKVFFFIKNIPVSAPNFQYVNRFSMNCREGSISLLTVARYSADGKFLTGHTLNEPAIIFSPESLFAGLAKNLCPADTVQAFSNSEVSNGIMNEKPLNLEKNAFVVINVADRIQASMPGDWWTKRDGSEIKLSSLIEKFTRDFIYADELFQARVNSSLGVVHDMSISISLIPISPFVHQGDLQKAVKSDFKSMLKNLEVSWGSESVALWAGLKKLGIYEVGESKYSYQYIGGQLAAHKRYGQTYPNDSSNVEVIDVYHIPLGDKKIIIRIASNAGNTKAKVMLDKFLESLVIK